MTLLCAAMPSELCYAMDTLQYFKVEIVLTNPQTYLIHSLRTRNVFLGMVLGVGARQARQHLDMIAQKFFITDIILVGIAGALSGTIDIHNVAVGTTCFFRENRQSVCATCDATRALGIGNMLEQQDYHPAFIDFLMVRHGVFSFAKYQEERFESCKETVLAVDMESGIVAHWANERRISCNIIKVISDLIPQSSERLRRREDVLDQDDFLQALKISRSVSLTLLYYFDIVAKSLH